MIKRIAFLLLTLTACHKENIHPDNGIQTKSISGTYTGTFKEHLAVSSGTQYGGYTKDSSWTAQIEVALTNDSITFTKEGSKHSFKTNSLNTYSYSDNYRVNIEYRITQDDSLKYTYIYSGNAGVGSEYDKIEFAGKKK